MTRILHVTQPTEAGVAAVVAGLVRYQIDAGHSVTVASPADGQFRERVIKAGASHRQWDARRGPARGLVREWSQLRSIVTDVSPEVIHLHSSKAGLVGRLTVRGGLPTVFQPHAWSDLAASGLLARAARAWERFAQRFTTTTICVSEAEAAHGLQIGVRRHVLVIPNGVDTTYFEPRERAEARVLLGVAPDVPLALCVGRLAKQKGQLELLAIWKDIVRDIPGALLVLVGNGPDEGLVRTQIGDGSVMLVPECADPRNWYAASDVVVAPSLWEGAALVPLEAMAMDRRVVGYDVGGLASTLGKTGSAVAPGDRAGLARLIADALGDRDSPPGARERATERFEVRQSYRSLTDASEQAAS